MTKHQAYHRLGILEIPLVLDAIKHHYETSNVRSKNFKLKQNVHGYMVKLNSLRLKTFSLHGTTCSCCGLQASYFAVERHQNTNQALDCYHLNLWGLDANGQEVMFTHDHTLARSLGGLDNITNTTTMCVNCNHQKSILERIEKEKQILLQIQKVA
jgi:5-methylcytosine-specific restriction endonuclease McrA